MKTVIKPKKTFSWNDIRELWQYRELMYFFTWRDLKVRYKQTAVGVAWAIFQPFITMIVFSIFFGKLAKMPSDGIPYPIFVYVGLLIWQFFSGALSETSNCLISNQSIVTKVYFPRLILPISSVLTKMVDFFVASIILIGMMVYYHFTPHLIGLLILPILLVITFLASVGGGLFLASINVKYRDVRYILPYFIQILMFLTPVIYPSSIAGKYSWILAINPMTGVLKAARAAILGTTPINWELLFISLVMTIIIFTIGLISFKKTERYFADII
ncbi:MAG: Teichoic acid translocation permease protein TagG [Parcubacteria group bacterium ADurb.Bin316]|nr:MAG: Teichoic acid translocation permease protein TagG [Parcubacteria group bacterium ADurb.Bin316]